MVKNTKKSLPNEESYDALYNTLSTAYNNIGKEVVSQKLPEQQVLDLESQLHLSTDINNNLISISRDAGLDVDSYMKQGQEFQDNYLTNLDSDLQLTAREIFTKSHANNIRNIHAQLERNKASKSRQDFNENIKTLSQNAIRYAIDGNFHGFTSQSTDVKQYLEEGVAKGTITQEEASKSFTKLRDQGVVSIAQNEFTAYLNRVNSPDINEFINDFEKRYDYVLDPEVKRDIGFTLRQAEDKLNTQKRAKAGLDASNYNQTKERLYQNLKDGYKINFTIMERLTLEDKETARQYIEQGRFSTLDIQERQKIINEATEEKKSDLISQHQKIIKNTSEDGLLLGDNQGLIDLLQLDLTNPDSIQRRREQSALLSQIYGTQVSPLTLSEVKKYTKNLKKMNLEEQQGLMRSLGQFQTQEIFDQFFTEGERVFSIAGGYAIQGQQDIATSILEGQELLKNDRQLLPSKENRALNDSFSFGDTYSSNPTYGNSLREAVRAIYVYKKAASGYGGLEEGDLDAAEWYKSSGIGRQLLDEVLAEIGAPVSIELPNSGTLWNDNYKIEPPVAGWSSAQVQRWIDGLQVSDIPVDIVGLSCKKAIDIIKRGRLNSLGQGRYLPTINGQYLIRSDTGAPFILEYKGG